MSTRQTAPKASKASNAKSQQAKANARRGYRTRQRRRLNRARNYLRFNRSTVPVAYGYNTSTYAQLYQQNGNTFIRGREIFHVTVAQGAVDLMIPVSPAKWIGTRTATLCSTFTSFRPMQLEIRWQPTIPTSVTGTMSVGTVFDGAAINLPTKDAALVALPVTNGGFCTNVWKDCQRGVQLGTSLRANLFPLYQVDPDDVPLWVLCATDAVGEGNLGNLVIEYAFRLHNPANNPQTQTAALNIDADITHDETGDAPVSFLTIAKSAVNNVLSIGKDYSFFFNQDLNNTASANILRVLQNLRATLTAIDDDNSLYKFNLDPAFATASNLRTVLLGSCEQNFQ